MLVFRFLIVVALLSVSTFAQSNPYESDIRNFEQADLRNPPPTNSILFLGSSTIVGWNSLRAAFPEFNVLNRGFGGSQASDVLFFYDRIVPKYFPPLIVFYEGDNDLASGKSLSQVFADYTNFTALVQRDLPDAHILFVAIKPSPSRANILNQQRTFNERLREFTETSPKLHYADTFNPFLTSTGQFRPELYVADQLHLSAAGYALWESIIVPIVEDWAARYPVNVRKSERNGVLIDFGSANSLSGQPDPTVVHWNNMTTIGSSNNGSLSNLVTTAGTITPLSLQMVSRFNGANENGTLASTNFPATATRDSLFGNTETFSGLANITPIFKIAGLSPAQAYRVSFYASRMGVSDNRETRYTVSGLTNSFTDLNAANNTNTVSVITNVRPSTHGELRVELSPGPNNNNANHFTYLGALRLEWTISTPRDALLIQPTRTGTGLALQVRANAGMTYRLESSTNLVDWDEVRTITMQSDSEQIGVEEAKTAAFYRLVKL
ncbi:MAG TPA: GDSL-type esterase/lipase family protein [Verrucomicrobiae bacterium]